MKRYFSIFLSVSILFSLFAGLGGVVATEALSISADKTVLVVGQSTTLTITTTLTMSDLSVSSSNNSIVTVDESTNTAYAVGKGTAIITLSGTVKGTRYTDTVTIKVRTPTGLISGEEYYVMNHRDDRTAPQDLLLSIPSGGDYDGAQLCGMERSGSNRAKWTVEIAENGNGVTRLINVSSSSDRALYIDSTSDVVLYSSTSNTSRSQIALHRVESGTYQGKYLMRYNGKFVSMNVSGDIYLASSLNQGAYWSFMAVDKGDVSLYSQYYNYQVYENGSYI